MARAVEANGIRKEYGKAVAVQDLELTVEAGEILGVLGPNGAGKTTAIRVLTTVLSPTRGSFSVAGIPHSRPAEIRRRIGVLPESAGYPEQQTGAEFLRYHTRLYGHGRTAARAIADALLVEVGLEERGRSLVAGYSRGMRQRLGIARALVNTPQVVFLDEPTLGLDPAGQRQVLELVRRMARERGAAVLLSTHLLAEVEEVCGRVVILNRGRLVASGTVSEVARRAAAPRSMSVRVPPEHADRALATLAGIPGVRHAEHANGLTGSIQATVAGDGRHGLGNEALRTLLEQAVPVLGFEVEGARLSDAFLAITEER
jgi:ABC-2 type transport system ATP-binding protein